MPLYNLQQWIGDIRNLADHEDQWSAPSQSAIRRYQIAMRNAGCKSQAERTKIMNRIFPEWVEMGRPATTSKQFAAGQIKAITLWLNNDQERAQGLVLGILGTNE